MNEPTPEQPMYFNGINGESGDYEIPPLSGRTLSAIITKEEKPENLDELKAKYAAKSQAALGLGEGLNANKLEEAGWGVIFAADTDPQIIEALQPLLDLRKDQAGKDHYHPFQGAEGYRPGMSKTDFLSKYGVGPGPVDPLKIPYYLLLVGDPEQIPYSFQTQLDVPYSVGRISFKTPQEYANYAASVVAVERKQVKLPRRAAFFGVQNPDDPATALSKADLVQPLLEALTAQKPEWQFNAYLAAQARRGQLDTLLGGDPAQTPALLFSASHGMGFPNGDKRQFPHQGALLCQNWPGPEKWGKRAIPEEFYFAGDHLSADRNLLGMIAFLFACYSAGTPEIDQFSKQFFRDRVAIAPRPFLANLPMKMLGLPRGGALAVVGHVERAWGYSFKWTQTGQQAEAFQSALLALLSGKTVGLAVEYFNERYAEIATVLGDKLEDIEFGKKYDPYELAKMWTANNDARGYTILGDPAVRLPVVEDNLAAPRPETSPIILNSPLTPPPPTPGDPNPPPVPTQPVSPQEKNPMDTPTNFSPPPAEPENLDPALKLDLNKAYVKHIKDGYTNTDEVFKQILNAFLTSHYSTVIMYWAVFIVGIAVVVSGFLSQNIWATLAAGFGVGAFVTFFISRSISSIEQNLLYITWLGVIYNTYWVHQQWSHDPDKAQQELDKANRDALAQLKELVDHFNQSVKNRPALSVPPANPPATPPAAPPAKPPAAPPVS